MKYLIVEHYNNFFLRKKLIDFINKKQHYNNLEVHNIVYLSIFLTIYATFVRSNNPITILKAKNK